MSLPWKRDYLKKTLRSKWCNFCLSVSADGEKIDCGNETGTLGKAVELKCCYPGGGLKTNEFRVQWQLESNVDCVVYACLPDGIFPPQCERYKNRTEVKQPCLRLQLLNVSLEDSKIYECILQRKTNGRYQKIFHGLIRLEVAGKDLPLFKTGI